MSHSVSLDTRQRQALLERCHEDRGPEVRFRAHILLLLNDGHSWATVATLLFGSSRAIDRRVRRFHEQGIGGLAGRKPARPFRSSVSWVAVVVRWVTGSGPRRFGFLWSRWCCEAIALLMLRRHEIEVSRETVRRWLHRGGLVDRRPRPTLGPKD